MSGIPRQPSVPGDLVRAGDEMQTLAPDERGRHELGAERLTHGWYRAAGIIVVAHGRTPEGELRALSSEETLDHMLRSFSSATDPQLLRAFFPIAAALTRLGGHWLGHGGRVDTRLDAAERMLATAASRSELEW